MSLENQLSALSQEVERLHEVVLSVIKEAATVQVDDGWWPWALVVKHSGRGTKKATKLLRYNPHFPSPTGKGKGAVWNSTEVKKWLIDNKGVW